MYMLVMLLVCLSDLHSIDTIGHTLLDSGTSECLCDKYSQRWWL